MRPFAGACSSRCGKLNVVTAVRPVLNMRSNSGRTTTSVLHSSGIILLYYFAQTSFLPLCWLARVSRLLSPCPRAPFRTQVAFLCRLQLRLSLCRFIHLPRLIHRPEQRCRSKSTGQSPAAGRSPPPGQRSRTLGRHHTGSPGCTRS